jgi:hypothetical protein
MKSMLTNLGEVEKPMSAIPIIRRAICKLQEKPYQLTQLHCLLCQACLMSNNLKPALSILDQEIYVLGTESVSLIFIFNIAVNLYYHLLSMLNG